MKTVFKVFGGVFVSVLALGVIFLEGMRRKSPVVLDAVRKSSRAMKPMVLKTAGTPGASASVIHHVGRRSGTVYQTPVDAVPTEDGFVIALPYGENTDWLKNVLASGLASIVHDGVTHAVDTPEVLSMVDAAHLFPASDQRTLRLFKVDICLRVRHPA
jgi:deazaflavin-dependent oxidoreductase (nitroreductase family)